MRLASWHKMIAVAGALAIVFGLGNLPAFALMSYDCSDYCYSIGAEHGTFAGLEGQWDDRVISIPADEIQDDFAHLNNEMWLITSAGPFVEEGLSDQCTTGPPTGTNQTCTGNGGTESYLQFWGDQGASGLPAFHLIDTLSADYDNHVYEL
jgi:hypothetical protein